MGRFSLSEFFISAVELVEAEAESIKDSFVKSAGDVIFTAVIAVLFIAGCIFAFIGIRMLFEIWVGEVGSYFLTSVIVFLLCGALYGVSFAKRKR